MGKLIQLRKKQHFKKIKCCDENCDFEANYFSEFEICLDPDGESEGESGLAACPECHTIQPFSYFADSILEKNGKRIIDESLFNKLLDTFDVPENGIFDEDVARFNTIYSEVPNNDEQRYAN